VHALDAWLHWRLAGLAVAGAQALYQTVITLTLSFLVFTFGSLLVAIQVAGAQLTPRIIATTLLRDNVVRYSVGLFVFTLIFAVGALNRLEESVHELVAVLTAVLGVACIAVFLFLIDYAARLLRPVSIVARVGEGGVEVGRPRVVLRTPNWEDFVHVACIEIRKYGADNIQVARRLRAMLLNLMQTLPPHRHAVLEEELDRLDQAVERLYSLPGDRALARIPDLQGLGGSTGVRTTNSV
jgi:uncharacterized membrane protein